MLSQTYALLRYNSRSLIMNKNQNKITAIAPRYIFAVCAGTVPLLAVYAVAISGDAGNGIVSMVEHFQSNLIRVLDNFATNLQFGFAFAAGMVATINPCGFPMLPAYLGLYVGNVAKQDTSFTIGRLIRGFMVGTIVTSGMVFLFGIAGLVISGGFGTIIDIMPWAGLLVGISISLIGGLMVTGTPVYSNLAGRAASKIGSDDRMSVRGYFLFGLSYGVASLSCTLPIFIAVTGISLTSKSFFDSVVQFIFYALGMGSIIIPLTLAVAVFKGTVERFLQQAIPYMQRVSAILLISAGTYIVFYWLTLGDLI